MAVGVSALLVLTDGVVQAAVGAGVGVGVLGGLRVAVDVRVQRRDMVDDVGVVEGAVEESCVCWCGGEDGRADSENGSGEDASLHHDLINGRRCRRSPSPRGGVL